jgi:ureidoacrylate peracid hydrolase
MAERSDLAQAALLLVDVQRDFLDEQGALPRAGIRAVTAGDSDQLLGRWQGLVAAMRAAGRPIVWVMTELRDDAIDSSHAPTWLARRRAAAGSFLVAGSWGAGLVDGLIVEPGDHVVVKKGHSAFADTHLDRLLTNLGVDRYFLAGGGVRDSIFETARIGGRLGYEQILVTDAVYPLGSDDLRMLNKQADPVSTADVVEGPSAMPPSVPPVDRARPDYAMVLVDMQNDFMKPDQPNRSTIIENTQEIAAAMRRRGWPVIYVHVGRREDHLDDAHAPTYSRRRPAERGLGNGVTHCAIGSWGAEMVAELAPQPGDFMVEKKGNSGFGFTALHRTLRNLNARRLIVTGGAAGGCVQATVCDGAELGYDITVVADAVYGGGTRELDVLRDWSAVRPADEVLAELTGRRSPA